MEKCKIDLAVTSAVNSTIAAGSTKVECHVKMVNFLSRDGRAADTYAGDLSTSGSALMVLLPSRQRHWSL